MGWLVLGKKFKLWSSLSPKPWQIRPRLTTMISISVELCQCQRSFLNFFYGTSDSVICEESWMKYKTCSHTDWLLCHWEFAQNFVICKSCLNTVAIHRIATCVRFSPCLNIVNVSFSGFVLPGNRRPRRPDLPRPRPDDGGQEPAGAAGNVRRRQRLRLVRLLRLVSLLPYRLGQRDRFHRLWVLCPHLDRLDVRVHVELLHSSPSSF